MASFGSPWLLDSSKCRALVEHMPQTEVLGRALLRGEQFEKAFVHMMHMDGTNTHQCGSDKTMHLLF